jgi:hypothetical protein
MAKADLAKMTLGEQELWENLAGCSLGDLQKKGLMGKRLAALLYVFAKREDANAKFEDFLNMDIETAMELVANDDDPKGNNN